MSGLVWLRSTPRGRPWAASSLLTLALMCTQSVAAPVFTAGAESDTVASAGLVAVDMSAKGVAPGTEVTQPKTSSKAAEPVSDWARFRKWVRSFFDDTEDSVPVRQTQQPARVDPAFLTNILPGAFEAPVPGGNLASIAGTSSDVEQVQAQARAAERDLLRDLSRAAVLNSSVAAAKPAEGPPVPGTGERKTREVQSATPTPVGAQTAMSLEDVKPTAFSEPDTMQVRKTAQEKVLEGMLLSQLIGQVKPWAIGLAGLFILWQVIRLLIHALQASQARALRRAMDAAARGPRVGR